MDSTSRGTSSAYPVDLKPQAMSPNNRIVGYDLARAVAFLGMLFINFSALMGNSTFDPAWLIYSINIIKGRAAATFIVLAGAGLSLLAKSVYARDAVAINDKRVVLLKRALFLLVIGMFNFLISPISDILHFYAVYLFLGACLLTVSNLTLCALTLVTITSRPLFVSVFDFIKDWDLNASAPLEFLNLPGIIGHFLFNGCFPVLPWAAFMVMGMWVGRQNLSNRALRKKILLAGAGAVGLAESVSRIAAYMASSAQFQLDLKNLLPWFTIVAWDPMPLFMVSATGTALVVISLSMILVDKYNQSQWLSPFIAIGQTTLTLYVAHIIVGSFFLQFMEVLEVEIFLLPISATIVFYLGALIFAHHWIKRYQKGPLEWLMRRFLLFNNPSGTTLPAKAPL